MSTIQRTGAVISTLPNLAELAAWASGYDTITLDLGAGDGRFARSCAVANPRTGVIAVDTCADSARSHLRRAPGNLRFIVADACALPGDVIELAGEVTLNFPWGKLLRALLADDPAFVDALTARPFTVRVNAGAFAEAGYAYDAGIEQLTINLVTANRRVQVRHLTREDLRQVPSTWAKRLAFGRDPRAVEIRATD
jgi:16S rRNA (adenine(1408)-N(1))-methyltransferase